jgi:hypothetical protein
MKLSSSSDAQIAELLKESINQRNTNEKMLEQDEDRHFFLFLLRDFKRVPVERKMDVKLTIMQAIKAAIVSTPPTFNSYVTHPPQCYSNPPSSFYPHHLKHVQQTVISTPSGSSYSHGSPAPSTDGPCIDLLTDYQGSGERFILNNNYVLVI